MSAVAGYAAWRLGVPVCYLESRAYNEQMRRPEPDPRRSSSSNHPCGIVRKDVARTPNF